MIDHISPSKFITPSGENFQINKRDFDNVQYTNTLISHEVPLSLLEMSRWFNDYDYALVHLFENYPQYFDFYKKSVEMGRMVILDNSLYELGEAFDMAKYAEWILKLRPTHYIIPDTFWDSDATIKQAMMWMSEYGWKIKKEIPGIKIIGVAQGSSYQDIKKSYKFLETFCDVIAFTFKFSPKMQIDPDINLTQWFDDTQVMYPCYEISGESLSPEDKQAICRYAVLWKLDQEGIINQSKEHHLLGLQNTTALFQTCRFPWVTSIDTSNPIINGYLGNIYYFNEEIMNLPDKSHTWMISYVGNSGHPKPKLQLKDIFESLTPKSPDWELILNDIKHNVREFREIVNPSNYSTILIGDRIMQDDYIIDSMKDFLSEKIN